MKRTYPFVLSPFNNFSHTVLQWGPYFMILLIVGCVQNRNVEQPPTNLPLATLSSINTVIPATTTMTTAMPQSTGTVVPSETATPHPTTPQPTLTPTPENELINWTGQFLIYYDGDGIYRFNLETDNSQLIVPIFNQGIVWISHAEPVFNGQEIVYWYVEGEWFIVKVVNGVTGQDRPLLTIEDDDFTSARGSWLGQGRFFELAVWGEDENGIPLVKQWYLFDIFSDTIIGMADNNPGSKICYGLATSPKSNNIATWCSFDGQFDEEGNYTGRGEYFVVESNGEYWSTITPPDQIVVETFGINQKHIWSPDGKYVLLPRSSMIDVENSQSYELFNKEDIYLNTYDAQFSPDSRFLSYEYDVCEFDNFCQRILDLETGNVVWDSSGLFEPPTHFFTWSPDGSYFVIRVGNGDYNIIETEHFLVVKSIAKDTLLNAIELVWLNQLGN